MVAWLSSTDGCRFRQRLAVPLLSKMAAVTNAYTSQFSKQGSLSESSDIHFSSKRLPLHVIYGHSNALSVVAGWGPMSLPKRPQKDSAVLSPRRLKPGENESSARQDGTTNEPQANHQGYNGYPPTLALPLYRISDVG